MSIKNRLVKLEQAANKGRLSPPVIFLPPESSNPKLYQEMMGKVEGYRQQGIEVRTVTFCRA